MSRSFPMVLALALAACAPKTPPESAGAPDAGAHTATAGASEGEVAAAPPASKKVPVDKRVDRAADLLAKGPADEAAAREALEILEGLRRDAPDHPILLLNLGIAQQRLGRLDDAASSYEAVIARDPTLGDAWLYLGQIERSRGRLDEAIAQLREGIGQDAENMDLRVALVATLRESGRAEEAVAEGREALSVHADNVQIYNNMGLAYLDLDEYVLAKFVFQKAMMAPGGDTDPHVNANLGWTFYLEGQPALARYRLEEARKLDPDFVPTLVYLGHVYMDDHNWTDAVEVLEAAAAREPNNPALQLNLGICYRWAGRAEESRRAYERALQLDPADAAPLFNLGILLGDSVKDYDAAIDAFQRYIDQGGEEAELASEYMADVEREKKRVERRKKAEEERQKREQERLERQKLLEQAEKKKKADPPPADPPPADAAPASEGEGEGAPEAEAPEPEASAPDGSNDAEPPAESNEAPWGEPQ